MMPTNNKLINRGVEMIMTELGVEREEAEVLLRKYGSVRKAVEGKNNSGLSHG
jgi:N-acetylmuramic acid 6-phosphate etherase